MKLLGKMQDWRFRWHHTYSDGTSKYGAWNGHVEKDFSTRESKQDRTKLIRASLQGRHSKDPTVFNICSIPVGLYSHFNWIFGMNVGLGSGAKRVQSGGYIVGASIFGKDYQLNAFIDGNVEVFSGDKSFKTTLEKERLFTCQ